MPQQRDSAQRPGAEPEWERATRSTGHWCVAPPDRRAALLAQLVGTVDRSEGRAADWPLLVFSSAYG